MIIKINDNISIWQEFNPLELSLEQSGISPVYFNKLSAKFGLEIKRISIKDRWFDIIHSSELVRKRNKSDGYYRVIYIQINMDNGEYYIGKANRPKWSELKRYHGSGLKFTNKFNKNMSAFVRYFIAACKTAEETQELEASIVNRDLLSDEQCLNLVAGGGGISNHRSIAETSERKRQHMKNNPEQFLPMLISSKKAFQSGNTPELRARNKSIKVTMGSEKYREMSRERMTKWKKENPVEYAEARRKSSEKIKTPEVQVKRQTSLNKWKTQNPEAYNVWQEKLATSRTSQTANKKRKESLSDFNINNPIKARNNAEKRAKAAAAKNSKAVSMLDLESGSVLRNFPSAHAAARWLVQEGKAKNTNCVSSINAVCLRRACTYGYRKKAYGYSWRFAENEGQETVILSYT